MKSGEGYLCVILHYPQKSAIFWNFSLLNAMIKFGTKNHIIGVFVNKSNNVIMCFYVIIFDMDADGIPQITNLTCSHVNWRNWCKIFDYVLSTS